MGNKMQELVFDLDNAEEQRVRVFDMKHCAEMEDYLMVRQLFALPLSILYHTSKEDAGPLVAALRSKTLKLKNLDVRDVKNRKTELRQTPLQKEREAAQKY